MVRECVGLCGLCQGDKGQECLVTGNLGQRHHKKSSDLLQHFVCPSQNSFLPKMRPVQSFYQYRKRIIYTKLPQYYFRDHFQGGSVPNNTLNSFFTSLGKVCVCVGGCFMCGWVSVLHTYVKITAKHPPSPWQLGSVNALWSHPCASNKLTWC